MKFTLTPAREVGVALGVCAALTFVTFRAGPLLTFDGYHYCEFAKLFSVTWPDRFGNHWPFGWPLAGALLARLGVPAYVALLALSLASAAVLLGAAAFALKNHPSRLAIILALAATPVVAPQLGGVLTELPFAAVLLLLGLFLAHWPARSAIWGAAGCAVLALGIRYAGLVALAMIATQLLARWADLHRTQRLREAITSLFAAGLVSALLLGLNILRSGHASGAGRGAPPGLVALPQELASFGWSLPSALLAGGLRDRIGPETALGWIIGGICFLLIAALCLAAWLRPRSAYSRPLALISFGYSTGMAVLHCIGDFDALYNARTFVPALAPLAILAGEQLSAHRRCLLLACAAIFFTGLIAAGRGISREIGNDVRLAVASLRPRIGPTDHIVINDHAMSVSAYFPQLTDRLAAANWQDRPEYTYVVVAGKPLQRDGRSGPVAPDWVDLTSRLTSTGRYRYLVREPGQIVLERVPGSPPAP